MSPRPPVLGSPIAGVAVRALTWKLLLPAAIRDSGLRMLAIATCPTTTCWPSEYCARIWPPSANPTRTNWAAAEPFCELAEGADDCPNCVIRPTPAVGYGSQSRCISAAPLVSPGMSKLMGGAAAGDVKRPARRRVSVPRAPEISRGVRAVPPLTSSPGIVTLYDH